MPTIETAVRTHVAFPSIEQFRTVVKIVRDRSQHNAVPLPKLTFVGSVKLHGTNAGVTLDPNGDIYAQSRSSIITPEEDNAGFAKYVEDNRHLFDGIYQSALPFFSASTQTLVVYGEWCGGNIQKGIAINGLPKMFVVFAIRAKEGEQTSTWFTPEQILRTTGKHVGSAQSLYCIYDFPAFEIEIDFARPEESQNKLAELTNAVEQECPVGKALGVSGVGEGIVWCAQLHETFNTSDLIFKVKGEKHSETKVKTLAAVDIEKVNNIRELVEKIVTPHRLDKKFEELRAQLGSDPDIKSTGAFLKIVGTDVHKEEADTIGGSGLDGKDVMSAVSRVARQWFMERITAV